MYAARLHNLNKHNIIFHKLIIKQETVMERIIKCSSIVNLIKNATIQKFREIYLTDSYLADIVFARGGDWFEGDLLTANAHERVTDVFEEFLQGKNTRLNWFQH